MKAKKCSKCNIEPEISAKRVAGNQIFKVRFSAEVKCPKCGKICYGLVQGSDEYAEHVFESGAISAAVEEWNRNEDIH